MPLPRFEKLDEPRRRSILAAAADEFGERGFEQASYNRIIERAGISKGAMYYYFADKDDLFRTVLDAAIVQWLTKVGFPFEADDASSFWTACEAMYARSLRFMLDDPQNAALCLAIINARARLEGHPALIALNAQMHQFTSQLVEQGQRLGAVREDLPTELIVEAALSLMDAGDRWLAKRWDEITPDVVDETAVMMVGLFDASVTRTCEETMNDSLPPGPRGLFGVRNVLRFTTDSLGFLTELKLTHGDVVGMKLLGKPWFMLNHPEDIEDCVVKNRDAMGRDVYIEILQRALGMGLLTNEGESWKRQRKLMANAFTPKRIRTYGEAMARVGDRGLRGWRDGQQINIHEEMSRVALEVVAEVLFGASVDEAEVRTVRDALEDLNDYFANSPEAVLLLPEWVPTPRHIRVKRAVEAIDSVIYRIIAERRRGEERDDLLGTLLAAQDDGGQGMSDQQLRDEAVTLFLAGHETTALMMAHTFYLLSKYPEAERKLYEEVTEVLEGRMPTSADVKRLPYAERVLKETMRLCPPAWTLGRTALEDVEIAGYRIPAGAQILMSQWVVHRDPRWYPNPEAFDPDRWEDPSSIPRYAYFPFGGGPRVCIGNHFAMMEATLLLAITMQRYRLELLEGQRLDFNPSVTLRPKGPGLLMRVHERPRLARSIRPPAPVATL